MNIPETIAQARRDVLTPELAAVVPSVTHTAWALLKAARGQPINAARGALLQQRHHMIAATPANTPAICTAAELGAAVARATPAIQHQVARRGYPVRSMAGWLRGQIAGPETGGAA